MNVQAECLFSTKIKYTYDEYKKYVMTFQKKRIVLTSVLVDVFLFIVAIVTKVYLFFPFLVLIPLIEYYSVVRPAKKVYYSSKLAVDVEISYRFYGSYFVKESVAGYSMIEYDKLLKIVETKTNFYLMVAANQGLVLKKSEMPKGLDEFLRKLDIKNKK